MKRQDYEQRGARSMDVQGLCTSKYSHQHTDYTHWYWMARQVLKLQAEELNAVRGARSGMRNQVYIKN